MTNRMFPLLSRFQNTVIGTLRNATVLAAAAFPTTIGMTAATFFLPVAAWFFRPVFPLLLLFGFSGAGYICALLYSPVFKKIENKGKEEKTEEEDPEN